MIGKIKVSPMKGKILEDIQVIGQMDPYILIKYNNQQYQSKTSKSNKGQFPQWDQNIFIPLEKNSHKMEIILMDQQVISDRRIGTAFQYIPMFQSFPNQQKKVFVLLVKEGQQIGSLEINFQYEKPLGSLTIKLLSALFEKDHDMIGQMDPFCQIVYTRHKKVSKVQKSGGKNPIWNQEFHLEIVDSSNQIQFTAFDQDTASNDLIGVAQMPVSQLLKNEEYMKIKLLQDKKNAGVLQIGTVWKPY